MNERTRKILDAIRRYGSVDYVLLAVIRELFMTSQSYGDKTIILEPDAKGYVLKLVDRGLAENNSTEVAMGVTLQSMGIAMARLPRTSIAVETMPDAKIGSDVTFSDAISIVSNNILEAVADYISSIQQYNIAGDMKFQVNGFDVGLFAFIEQFVENSNKKHQKKLLSMMHNRTKLKHFLATEDIKFRRYSFKHAPKQAAPGVDLQGVTPDEILEKLTFNLVDAVRKHNNKLSLVTSNPEIIILLIDDILQYCEYGDQYYFSVEIDGSGKLILYLYPKDEKTFFAIAKIIRYKTSRNFDYLNYPLPENAPPEIDIKPPLLNVGELFFALTEMLINSQVTAVNEQTVSIYGKMDLSTIRRQLNHGVISPLAVATFWKMKIFWRASRILSVAYGMEDKPLLDNPVGIWAPFNPISDAWAYLFDPVKTLRSSVSLMNGNSPAYLKDLISFIFTIDRRKFISALQRIFGHFDAEKIYDDYSEVGTMQLFSILSLLQYFIFFAKNDPIVRVVTPEEKKTIYAECDGFLKSFLGYIRRNSGKIVDFKNSHPSNTAWINRSVMHGILAFSGFEHLEAILFDILMLIQPGLYLNMLFIAPWRLLFGKLEDSDKALGMEKVLLGFFRDKGVDTSKRDDDILSVVFYPGGPNVAYGNCALNELRSECEGFVIPGWGSGEASQA